MFQVSIYLLFSNTLRIDTFGHKHKHILLYKYIDEKLNRKGKSTDFPEEYLYKENTITDSQDVANSFNEYFSNIGPILSEKMTCLEIL